MGYDSRDLDSYSNGTVTKTTTNITKGTVGTLSKIEEELRELKEAERLQDPVNQLVELRDIIGDCAAYMEQKYPKIDFINLCRSALSMNQSRR